MTTQQYLMISTITNIVENICVWDGDTNTWQPPADTLMLIQVDIPAMVWILDTSVTPSEYVLTEQIGSGDIGFTWDGSILTTNQPKPTPIQSASNQPKTSGVTTI